MVVQKPVTKSRSPNYPAISLREAIDFIQKVYGDQKQHPTTREVLAKLMGYKSLNGASATMVSALSKYGLVEGYGDDLKVSDIGRDLCIHHQDDAEYKDAITVAAYTPAFFRELHDLYGDNLPSEHGLRTSLIKKGFNDKAIPNVVRAYRDTMDLVKEVRGDTTVTELQPAEREQQMVNPSGMSLVQTSTGNTQLRGEGQQQPIQFPVSEAGWVILHTPESMTESEWELMMTILGNLKGARVSRISPVIQEVPKFEQST